MHRIQRTAHSIVIRHTIILMHEFQPFGAQYNFSPRYNGVAVVVVDVDRMDAEKNTSIFHAKEMELRLEIYWNCHCIRCAFNVNIPFANKIPPFDRTIAPPSNSVYGYSIHMLKHCMHLST